MPATAAPSGARIAATAIGLLAGCALFFVAFLTVLSPLQQARDQDVLYSQFRSQLDAATAPFGVRPIPAGSPVAIVSAPSIGLQQVVVEGTSSRDLRSGPGHLRATPLPGQLGTAVLFGRSTTYGGPFRDVPELQRRDRVQVTTGQGVFSYRVEDVRRQGDPQPPALTDGQGRLLLVTTQHGLLSAHSTVYVDALLVSKAAPTPPRGAIVVSPAEQELADDTSGLLALAGWLLLLVGGGVFVAWGVTHWGGVQTWVIGAPVVLAALWGASDSAALLLPNLM